MALTDMQIRKAKPKAKPYKLYDSLGLFLLVNPTGSKLWRQRYKRHGKERILAHGAYPAVSLPKRVQLGPNRVGWIEAEVLDWLQERVDRREDPTRYS